MTVNDRQVIAKLSVPTPFDCAYLDFSECAGIAPRKINRVKLTAEDTMTFQRSGAGAIFSELNFDAPNLRVVASQEVPAEVLVNDGALESWCPIASAPRDGTAILAYGEDEETQRHYTVAEFRGGEWWPSESPLNHADAAPMKLQPTHWQALEPFA